jgi:hypothetical protein
MIALILLTSAALEQYNSAWANGVKRSRLKNAGGSRLRKKGSAGPLPYVITFLSRARQRAVCSSFPQPGGLQ